VSQLIDHLPDQEFRRCVQRYSGNHRVRTCSCWDQFLCLTVAPLTFRERLRDSVARLRARDGRLYYMGIRGTVSRSTLRMRTNRGTRASTRIAEGPIAEARHLYLGEGFGVDLTSRPNTR
jgi:hypothetical protein